MGLWAKGHKNLGLIHMIYISRSARYSKSSDMLDLRSVFFIL